MPLHEAGEVVVDSVQCSAASSARDATPEMGALKTGTTAGAAVRLQKLSLPPGQLRVVMYTVHS